MIIELVRIDGDARLTHARGHDGNALSVFGKASITIDAADGIDQDGVMQEGFRNPLGAQRIARH